MAISLRAQGTWVATSAASQTPAIPAAQVTGDMMILIAAGKPYDLGWSVSTSGWQSLGTGSSGTTAAGIDVGSMKVEAWYKIATSDTETNPTVTEGSPSFNVIQSAVCVFQKGAAEEWVTPVIVFGADEVDGTALAFTFDSDPGGVAGDYVMLGCGINTDSMGPLTADLAPSWTGITFGTADAAVEGEGTGGGDMAAHYISQPVSSGSSSAAPTAAGTGTTSGTADRAEAFFIRLRAFTPAALSQPHFRIRSDDSQTLNTDAGWAGALDANATIDAEKIFRIRFEVATPDVDESTTFKLQYRRNGGTWTDVEVNAVDPPTEVDSTEIVLSGQYVDDAATTNVLSGSGLTFAAGVGLEDNQTPAIALNNQHTEYEWALRIRLSYGESSLYHGRNADGDTFEYRVVDSTSGAFTGSYVNPTITLNVPDYLIGGTFVETAKRVGPICDANGNLYVLLEFADTSAYTLLLKSADGGKSWTIPDSANLPTTTDLESADIEQVGSTLHILSYANDDVRYHTFRTSDNASPDTWNVRDQVVHNPTTPAANQDASVTVRSDGTVVAAYRTDVSGTDERIGIRVRSTGGTWGSEQILDTTAGASFSSVGVVRGASDLVHIFYVDITNGALYYKTLNTSDVLSGRTQIATGLSTNSGSREHPLRQPFYYDDDGAEVVWAVYSKSTDYLWSRPIVNGTPGTEVQVSGVAVAQNNNSSSGPTSTTAADGKTVHVVYADNSTSDIWWDKNVDQAGWGTDVEILNNTTCRAISGNVYTHSAGNGGAKVLGYFYDTSVGGYTGQLFYSEYTLAAETNLVIQNATHSHSAGNVVLTQVHSLTVQNGTHAHSAANVALTQVHQLAIQATSHGHAAANVLLGFGLTIQSATHAHSAENVTLDAGATTLVIANGAHAHVAGGLTLVVRRPYAWSEVANAETPAAGPSLVIQGASHGHTAQNVALAQVHVLAVAAASHAHVAANVVLTQVHVLTIQSATHAHSAENISLSGAANLVVQSATHGHTAGNVVLAQVHQLAVAGAAHSQTAGNVVLTQVHVLTIQSATHAHSAQNVTLGMAGDLAISDGAHAHVAGNVILTQVHTLAIQNASHGHSAQNVAVGVNLVVSAGLHGHTAANVALTQVHQLAIQNASHAHTSPNVTLGLPGDLAIANGQHSHSAANVALTQVHTLVIQSAVHGHTATTPSLTQQHVLVIQNAAHGHSAALVHLGVNLIIANGTHGHTAGNVTLTQIHGLAVQNSLHLHMSNGLVLTQVHALVVQNTFHGQVVDNVVLIMGDLGEPVVVPGTVQRLSVSGTDQRSPTSGTARRSSTSGTEHKLTTAGKVKRYNDG